MEKVKIQKDGVVQEVKQRYLNNFLDKGWKLVSKTFEKKVSKIGIAKVTADVIGEEVPLQEEEEQSSMPTIIKGEE